jgi:hypothetical protein
LFQSYHGGGSAIGRVGKGACSPVSTKRSAPARLTDARRFRIKVKFAIPPDGLGRVTDELYPWLIARLGRDGYAIHPDSWDGYQQASAVHLDDASAVTDLVAWLAARVPAVERCRP